MSDQKDRQEDSVGDLWVSNWEQQCIEQLESEPNFDDRLSADREETSQKLWLSFQNSATAVAQLYKDRLCHHSTPAVWISFQNAATAVTQLYKDCFELQRRGIELGIQTGQQRRTRDLVTWAKKKRRHIRRDDLLGFLCGKNVPPRLRSTPLQRSGFDRSSPRHQTSGFDRSSPRHPNLFSDGLLSPDSEMQPFREALALQGLNGAMASVSVDSNTTASSTQGSLHFGRRRHGAFNEVNAAMNPEELFNVSDSRKRNSNVASTDVLMESPPHKRGRFL
ncbi:HUWE1-associated protein modifying stress responses-like [Ptychodera flava]|uniref:HUWE1-associated protein modifying stress responses-like n=1 Tax=Ptychodera flava TaxID=63121 RepID=UPI00396A5E72